MRDIAFAGTIEMRTLGFGLENRVYLSWTGVVSVIAALLQVGLVPKAISVALVFPRYCSPGLPMSPLIGPDVLTALATIKSFQLFIGDVGAKNNYLSGCTDSNFICIVRFSISDATLGWI